MLGQYIDPLSGAVLTVTEGKARVEELRTLRLAAERDRLASKAIAATEVTVPPELRTAFRFINPSKRELKEVCRKATEALGRKLTKRERRRAAEMLAKHRAGSNG